MKNALISPNEKVYNVNTHVEIGERVAEVAETSFEIAPPLFWLECADDVVADAYYYDPASGAILLTPEPIPPVQPISVGAQTL
jgi:hypothetical protein